MNEIYKIFSEPLDPASRLYWPFLLSSLIIILIYSKGEELKKWKSASSILDLKIFTFNSVLKILVFPLILFSSYELSIDLNKLLYSLFPRFSGLNFNDLYIKIFITILAFVIDDFFRFFHHYLMHKITLFRSFHKTHHSALVLTPFTLFRAHPLEALLAQFRNLLSLTVIISFTSFLLQKPMSGLDILGVNLFGFLFNALLSNLRHSPVPLSFGVFEYLLISPRMHQIHHSVHSEHFNKNFGIALSLWDQITGSFYIPTKEDLKNIQYGIKRSPQKQDIKEATQFAASLKSPFGETYKLFKNKFSGFSESENLKVPSQGRP